MLRDFEIKNWLHDLQPQIDRAINSTPTGERRSALCDLNIFLQQAIEAFEKEP